MAEGKNPLKQETARDYAKATPEEIVADIERTRAHMDETLSRLGRRLHRRTPGKALGLTLGLLTLAAAGALGYLGYRGFRGRGSHGKLRHRLFRSTWHNAHLVEKSVLAARLAMAARKGKPAIIVVEPRKD